MADSKQSLSYREAGVNIDQANQLVEKIKHLAKSTYRPGVLGGIGGFGALFELSKRYTNPVLVSGTDGVGTKLKLAIEMNRHETIGIDLVAMCVNDVLTSGAEPLFFLDYFATGQLHIDQAQTVIASIAQGCKQANVALVGGETAEMPGLYAAGDYDLAGFCVGIVEKEKIIDGSHVKVNDTLIAIAASGPHANGYSLIRKVIATHSLDEKWDKKTLGELLLEPTRIYVKTIRHLLPTIDIRAIAHITGGGMTENIPRVLPPFTQAVIDTNSWQWPKIFQWLQAQGNITLEEMRRTFNLGVGLVVIVPENAVQKTMDLLVGLGETAWRVGHVASSSQQEPHVVYEP